MIPLTSCSGLYPVVTSALRCRTNSGTACNSPSALRPFSSAFGAHLPERIASHEPTHLCNERDARQQYSMIPITQQSRRAPLKVIHQLGDLVQAPERREGGLLADVGVARSEAPLDFGDEVSSHLFGGDVGKGAEGEGDGRGGGVVHVAVRARGQLGSPTRNGEEVLLERVGNERQDLLVLVEEEHDPEVA